MEETYEPKVPFLSVPIQKKATGSSGPYEMSKYSSDLNRKKSDSQSPNRTAKSPIRQESSRIILVKKVSEINYSPTAPSKSHKDIVGFLDERKT